MPIYVGNQKIEMSGIDKVYVGTTLVYQKTQPVVLVSIAVSGQTTTFNYGATFVFGGTVTATYSNGTTADVTSSSTFSGYNMTSPGTQTVTVSYTEDGVTKTTTYQITVKAQQFTITYRKAFWTGTAPATKTVNAGYALTASDLPTQTDSTSWSTIGWTTDGTNQVSAGYVVNSNITLKAIHRGIITSANLFKTARQSKYITESGSCATGTISMGNVGNCNSGTTTKTYALTAPSYSRSYSSYGNEGYCAVCEGAWGGQVTYMTPAHAGRFEWTPTTSSVTFTNPSNHTTANNYTACYPTVVFRRNDTGAHLWHTSQNSTAKISHAIQEPNSGATNIIYVSYGGNNGSSYGQQLARRTCYRDWSSTSISGNVTCNKSTVKETFYFYVT